MKTNLKIVLGCCLFAAFAFVGKPSANDEKIRIVIDAGHGGLDFGAQHDGILEKDIVSAISEKVKNLNNGQVELYLTRESDEFVKLGDRTEKINKLDADLVISLHVNASARPEKNGTEFYVAREGAFKEKSREIAGLLSSKFENQLNRKAVEVQEAPFHILKKSNAPSLIIELGYVTNDNDRNFLTDANSQQRIAQTLIDFFNELPHN